MTLRDDILKAIRTAHDDPEAADRIIDLIRQGDSFVICASDELYPDMPEEEPSCIGFARDHCDPRWHDKCGRFLRIGPVDMEWEADDE